MSAEIQEINPSDHLSYDPDTGVFVWIKGRRGKSSGAVAGSAHCNGYRQIMINKKNFLAHRVAWRMVHGSWPDLLVDHINGDKADNRIANLRLATPAQNLASRPPGKDNTSGFKGVSWNATKRKWQAAISVNNRTVVLGRFADKESAARAYAAAAQKYHGEFAYGGDIVRNPERP